MSAVYIHGADNQRGVVCGSAVEAKGAVNKNAGVVKIGDVVLFALCGSLMRSWFDAASMT